MSDLWTEGEPEPPRRSRLGLLASIGGAVVVLAAVGATGGWLLAGAGKSNQGSAGRSPSPSISYLSPSPSPSSAPSPTESTASIDGEFPLPDVTGRDFVDARRQLRDRRLGVQVVFDGKGDDRSVERTKPGPGEVVHAGITVKLHVPGEPPALEVPSLLGTACADAGQEAADRGLIPQYKPKKAGRVTGQDPQPYARARWNDRVTLYCDGGATSPTPY
jgi:hypothetical protein